MVCAVGQVFQPDLHWIASWLNAISGTIPRVEVLPPPSIGGPAMSTVVETKNPVFARRSAVVA